MPRDPIARDLRTPKYRKRFVTPKPFKDEKHKGAEIESAIIEAEEEQQEEKD